MPIATTGVSMKKKTFFTGAVFQFYIREVDRFAYCKFFDFKHISPFHGLLAKVFDHFTDENAATLHELSGVDWLFGAKSMNAWPGLRKESGWRYLGMLNSALDDEIPVFKDVQSFPYLVEDNNSIGPWFPVFNFHTRGKECSYDEVRHLETENLKTSLSLALRTGMEYCRKHNIEISRLYNLNDDAVKYAYWDMINTPVYSSIPHAIRGKFYFK